MGGMSNPPPPPSQQATIETLLSTSRRELVPIRKTFVQQGESRNRTGGPLAKLVANQDVAGLDQYLLLHAKASDGDWSVSLDAAVWARAMGRNATPNGLTATSKTWNRLEKVGLITRSRSGRKAKITLLCEDGHGGEYTRPRTASDDRWLRLPYDYWRKKWYSRLSLPGKAMLLIALSLDDGFYLPFDKVEAWYGISRNSAQRGMAELNTNDLLSGSTHWESAPLSAIGHKQVINYTLRAPFGPHHQVLKLNKRTRRMRRVG